RELESQGHRFKTDHSDTEVLVHGWEQWGERLPERLNGMFAFAIWDQRKRCLFLVRDRHGIKPLYLATTANGVVAFGSEARALHASGLFPIEADPAGVVEYFGLMNLWHGRTPFRQIALLPPSTCEVIAPGYRRRHRYWDFVFSRERPADLASEAEAFRDV